MFGRDANDIVKFWKCLALKYTSIGNIGTKHDVKWPDWTFFYSASTTFPA